MASITASGFHLTLGRQGGERRNHDVAGVDLKSRRSASRYRVTVTLVDRSDAIHPPILAIASELGAPTGPAAELLAPMALGQEHIVVVERHRGRGGR